MAEVQGEGGEQAHAPRAPRGRHVMLALDDSAHSQKTLLWALEYLLKPSDQVGTCVSSEPKWNCYNLSTSGVLPQRRGHHTSTSSNMT